MDIKITGVSREIMEQALSQAKDARIAILGRMHEAISAPREALAEHAPRISTIQINPEFIGMVIGKGGETIRSLESEYEVQIDIEEDGTILVYATEGTKGDAAIAAIRNLTKEPEVGDEYTGRVVKTTDFGAFVELKKGTDGLLHVSNVGPGRVNHIEDVIQRGDILDVLVQEVDKARGRIGLKLVQKHENGGMVSPEELVERAKDAPPREPREDAARAATAIAAAPRRPAPRARRVALRVGSVGRRREAARHAHRRRGRPPRSSGRATAPSFFRRCATRSSQHWLNMPREPGRPRLRLAAALTRAQRTRNAATGSTTPSPRRAPTSSVGAVIASRRHRDNYEVAYLARRGRPRARPDDARGDARSATRCSTRVSGASSCARIPTTSRRSGSPSAAASSARGRERKSIWLHGRRADAIVWSLLPDDRDDGALAAHRALS